MRSADWQSVWAMRLAALADSPDSFESTLERELGFDEQVWRRRLESATTLQAFAGDQPLGMLTLVPDDGPGGTAQVTGLWVAPQARGRGAGSRMMAEAARTWAGLAGVRLRLWVVGTNAAALALYDAHGFEPTGRTGQFRGLPEIELARQVVEPPAAHDAPPVPG